LTVVSALADGHVFLEAAGEAADGRAVCTDNVVGTLVECPVRERMSLDTAEVAMDVLALIRRLSKHAQRHDIGGVDLAAIYYRKWCTGHGREGPGREGEGGGLK